MGKTQDNRDAAPLLYALLDFRDNLKECGELSPEVEESLKRTFQLLTTKSRNYKRYTETLRAGVNSKTWELGSENPYPREYCCLWCGEEWTVKNSDHKNQCNCPNSCNVSTM